jgi:membrane-associated phospholipid phosphatase
MFQTEIILFLQSLGSKPLTVFMVFITSLGYPEFYIPAIIVIIFGVNYKKGFLLVQVLLLTSTLTDYLKNFFALPRPCDVDANVLLPGKDYPNNAPFVGQGAKGFFDPLPAHVVEYYRSVPPDSYGFPSGHASSAVAFWAPIVLLFQKRWIQILSVSMIALMPLSRMYLGRHFLADVLGGLLLGFLVVAVYYSFVMQPNKLQNYLAQNIYRFVLDLRSIALLAYLVGLPLALLLLQPRIEVRGPAGLLGMNLAFLLVARKGLPGDDGKLWQRMTRVMTAIISYLGISMAIKFVIEYLFEKETATLEFFGNAATTFLFVWVATIVGMKFGFFKRQPLQP